LPAFEFGDGAKGTGGGGNDPTENYRAGFEVAVRSRWNRPEDLPDENFVAEANVTIDAKGKVLDVQWLSLSGNARWDASVKAAMGTMKGLAKPPPKGFPPKFVVRFDVESQRTEPIQASSS
jgi:TonB family protein